MSNTFTATPTLVDPGRVSASQTIRTTEIARLGDLQNYAFAYGGTSDVVNQCWDEGVLRIDSTTNVEVCEWRIPRPSNEHDTFKFRFAGFTSKSGGTVEAQVKFPLSSNVYTASVTISDGSRYASSFEELTVSITAPETELYCILYMVITAPSTGYVEVNNIAGRWSPLTSPLDTNALGQGSDSFIPQGLSRLGQDFPLPARFGVQTIENIEILRKRGRTLLNWSGSRNFMTGVYPAEGLGIGDLEVMYSNVALFAGMNQVSLDVDIFIKIVNYTSSVSYDIFGHQLTPVQNGWNSFGVTLRLDELSISNEFNLSMYKAGLENTATNASNLLNENNQVASSAMYISGLAIIGV
jgi:hypothetical protein